MAPKETLELIEALLKGWQLNKDIMEDSKVGLDDIAHGIAAMPTLWKGFAGVDKVDDEMAALDDEGRALIKAKIEEFVLANDKELEALIEELLEMILNLVSIAKKITNYLK